MTSPDAPRLALSVKSAASALDLTENTVRDLIKKGELASFRVADGGRKLRIPIAALESWIGCRVAAERGEEREPIDWRAQAKTRASA